MHVAHIRLEHIRHWLRFGSLGRKKKNVCLRAHLYSSRAFGIYSRRRWNVIFLLFEFQKCSKNWFCKFRCSFVEPGRSSFYTQNFKLHSQCVPVPSRTLASKILYKSKNVVKWSRLRLRFTLKWLFIIFKLMDLFRSWCTSTSLEVWRETIILYFCFFFNLCPAPAASPNTHTHTHIAATHGILRLKNVFKSTKITSLSVFHMCRARAQTLTQFVAFECDKAWDVRPEYSVCHIYLPRP